MRGPIRANQAAAIKREHHRQILNADVVNQLVISALQESRVDRDHRFHAVASKAGGKRHRVLFGDADIEVAIRIFPLEPHQAEPSRIAGVIPIKRASSAAMSHSQSPKIFV